MSKAQADMVSPPQTYKKRRDSTLAEKVKILELLQQPKASQTSVARNMGLSQSTISRVMKKRDEILERWNQNENPSRKRNRPFKHAKVDEALLEWLLFAKANNLPISGPILMRRAEAIAKEIGCPQFKPSNGWLWRWKERYRLFYRGYADGTDPLTSETKHNGITQTQNFKVLPDVTQLVRMELNKVSTKGLVGNPVTTNEQFRVMKGIEFHPQSKLCEQPSRGGTRSNTLQLAQVSENYHPDNIFYAVGAPFQFRIMVDQNENNGQHKEAVCIWLCCNMNGTEKRKMLVAHNLSPKSLGMQCLSPVSLKSTESGYLTEGLFTEWLLNWDTKLERQERKVLLVYAGHSSVPKVKLRHISLCVVSKDNMSSNQLFGQELLNEFSTLYRQLLLERLEEDDNTDKGNGLSHIKHLSKMTLVEASYTMNKAWLRVTTNTIKLCFQKSDCEPVIFCTKPLPINISSNEEIIPFMAQGDTGNVHASTPFSTALGSYKVIHIKEENDIDLEESGLEAANSSQSCAMQKMTISSLSCEDDQERSSPGCLSDQVDLHCFKSYLMPKDAGGISMAVVKSDNSRDRSHVQELKAACDIIHRYLSSQGQDMSTFFALQSQLERCLHNQNKQQRHNYMLKK
ncbi:tigger transposable element-derived protein 3-like [Discoglossus pictus]